MKTFLLIVLLFTTNAFAFEPCSYPDTWSFFEDLKAQSKTATIISKNPKKFRFIEKQMIHLTVTLQDWLSGSSKAEALEMFTEGSSDGEIQYFDFNGRRIALVRYWPGDNEFGAFFEMKNSAFQLLAEIRDSDIVCL